MEQVSGGAGGQRSGALIGKWRLAVAAVRGMMRVQQVGGRVTDLQSKLWSRM
jgi:hypothetical protein